MRKKSFLALAVMTVIVFACSKSSEDTVGGGGGNGGGGGGGGSTCDTAGMSYATDIVPILSANCYSCHGENTNSGSMGIILEGHDNIAPKALSGTLIGVITHAAGFPPMPQNGPKLSECNINKIRAWINNGALDN